MKRVLLLAATALMLSGCATNKAHEGMVFRDGAWYSPATDGRGDYYTSSPRPMYSPGWGYPWDFGIGLVPIGGYCSVQYRWCSSYWPHYDAYWYQPWVSYQPRTHRPRHRPASIIEPESGDEDSPFERTSEARDWPRRSSREDRSEPAPRSRGGGEGRRRRGMDGNNDSGGG